MMRETTYQTKQKQVILESLQAASNRPLTVDEITALINENGGKVGRTTVYRHLEALLSQGRVRKFSPESGRCATFQYVPDPGDCAHHMHLKCAGCGRYIHLDCDEMQQVNAHIFEAHHFRVDNAQSLLVGLCEDCLKEGRHGAD